MARRALQAALVAVLAIVLSLWWTKSSPAQPARDLVTGKNNTVLFLTTETHGTCNVHVATAYALAGNHPNVQIHYASFPSLRHRICCISNLAASPRGTAPETSSITFHALSGLPYKAAAITAAPGGLAGLIHHPGAAGAKEMCHTMKHAVTPWTVDDHVAQYDSARRIIHRVDPSLVVVDLVLYPGLAAVRDSRRKHVVLSPNVVSGNVPAVQPGHTMLWKYPIMGSGLPYPMTTFKQILDNIYLTFTMIRCLLSNAGKHTEELRARGVENPVDIFSLYDPAVPWITQTLPGAHVDVSVIPDNVLRAGPINLAGVEGDTDSAAARDLLAWVGRAPTVLVNLGTNFEFSAEQLGVMAHAVGETLNKVSGLQILWKISLAEGVRADDVLAAALPDREMYADRLRTEEWLQVEPSTLVLQENVVVYVHHGGAGAFHDALGAGIPQVALPQWLDLYDLATLAEYLDIGIWPCKDTSPLWEAGCLSEALLKLVDGSPESTRLRGNARRWGDEADKQVGRDVAAREVARLSSLPIEDGQEI